MDTILDKFAAVAAAFYTWIAAIYLGAGLLDMMYFNLFKEDLGISSSSQVFSAVADALLCISLVVFLSAIGAVAFSWKSRTARSLFIASLLVIILELITPVFFSWISQGARDFPIGPWLRITLGGLASVLAFAGMYAYYRQKSDRQPSSIVH